MRSLATPIRSQMKERTIAQTAEKVVLCDRRFRVWYLRAPTYLPWLELLLIGTVHLQMLARAFVPDRLSCNLPPDYLQAMTALERELVHDLDLDVFSPEAEESEDSEIQGALGYRRLAAACAFLRLARLHDTRLHVQPFYKVALTMQVTASLSKHSMH